jgi:hypothetical protein
VIAVALSGLDHFRRFVPRTRKAVDLGLTLIAAPQLEHLLCAPVKVVSTLGQNQGLLFPLFCFSDFDLDGSKLSIV